MAGKIFILDEWILHDLSGDNGNEKRAEAETFLEKMVAICDRIAILLGGIWAGKMYQLMRSSDVDTRRSSKLLFGKVILNSLKCDQIQVQELDLVQVPKGILQQVPRSDRYLLKLYYHCKADVLITTDMRHFGSLNSDNGLPNLNVKERDGFLPTYGTPIDKE